uniref:Uncharacterized protein n=1 Tax=Gouania willdenowi TaxID=441366 RepID=A0A8C5D352_GOUWI
MPESAEAVSATFSTNRNCTIEITNLTSKYCLMYPKVYTSSGFNNHSPALTIPTCKTEVCSFDKDDNTATGAVGLLTYDLFDMRAGRGITRIAIWFSVPYDLNVYKNELALAEVDLSCPCNKDLYKKISDGKELKSYIRSEKAGCGVKLVSTDFVVCGTQSSIGRCIVKVQIFDRMGC